MTKQPVSLQENCVVIYTANCKESAIILINVLILFLVLKQCRFPMQKVK